MDPARRPVCVLALLIAGYLLARHALDLSSGVLFSLSLLASAAAALARGRACAGALAVGWLALSAGFFTMRVRESPGDRPIIAERGAGDERGGAIIDIEGLVVRADARGSNAARGPSLDDFSIGRRDERNSATIRVDLVNGRPASGLVRAALPGEVAARPGDRIRARGEAAPIAPRLNPGAPDARAWASSRGLFATMRIPGGDLVEVDPSGGGAVRARVLRARAALAARASAVLPDDGSRARSLLRALILGIEDAGLDDSREAFTRLGLAHLVAISGLNLSLMAGLVLVGLRLTGDHGRLEHLAAGVVVVAYLLILPHHAPVLRAGIMALALLAARASGRRYDPLAVLAWTAALLLLWSPMDLFTLSFQLSFGLVAGLIRLARPLHERLFGLDVRTDLPTRASWTRSLLLEPAKRLLSTSLLCWAIATPVVLHHTGLVSPFAVLTTTIVSPLILLVMGAGYVVLVLASAVPPMAHALAPLADALARVSLFLVEHLDAIPGLSFRIPAPSLAWTLAATLVVVLAIARARRGPAIMGVLACAAWLAVEAWARPRPPLGADLRIDTLAVGDGTCHLLRAGPDAILWDCGSTRPGIGRGLVPRAVRALGPAHVRRLVISHPNLDHYNGVLDAADALGVREVLASPAVFERAVERPDGAEAFLLSGLESRGIAARPVKEGDSITLGSGSTRVAIDILSPPAGAEWPESNDHSLVALASVGRTSFLLTGDAQAAALGYVLAAHPGLRADAVELPTTGARTWPRSASCFESSPGWWCSRRGRRAWGFRSGTGRDHGPSGDARRARAAMPVRRGWN